MNQTYMKEKPILPLLLSMALPMVISMMVNSLYNIVDSYFVARISEEAMTALSLVYPIQNFITSVGVGFGIGINAAIAFFLGAQDQKKADTAATQGLFLSVIHGIVLTEIGFRLFARLGRFFQHHGQDIPHPIGAAIRCQRPLVTRFEHPSRATIRRWRQLGFGRSKEFVIFFDQEGLRFAPA